MKRGRILHLLCVSLLCFTCLMILYFSDNKYTMNKNYKPAFLVKDWYLYPDVLLNPQSVKETNAKHYKLWIGQISNFSQFHVDKNPFGIATYTTNYIAAKGEICTLYIQEPFTSVRVYVNSKLLVEQGSFENGSSKVKDILLSFPSMGKNEILIQIENHTHYYSGIYYPPMIGKQEDVKKTLLKRFLFYGCLSFVSLAVAIYSFMVWWNDRNDSMHVAHRTLGVLTISFAMYCTYPFMKISGFQFAYNIEDGFSILTITSAFFLCSQLCYQKPKWIETWWKPVTISVCVMVMVLPNVFCYLPSIVRVYGGFLTGFKVFQAGLMFYLICKSERKRNWLLDGVLIYAICLGVSMLWINRFEPACYGWFEEYGLIGLVMLFTVNMVSRTHQMMQDNNILTKQLHEEVAKQTTQIQQLMKERQQMMKELLHDLRKPMTTSSIYLSMLQQNQITMDQPTKESLAILKTKYDQMSAQMQQLQRYNDVEIVDFQPEKIWLKTILETFYEEYRPDMQAMNRVMCLDIEAEGCIYGDIVQLNRVFMNLLSNAIAFTKENDKIHIVLTEEKTQAVILFSNTGEPVTEEQKRQLFVQGYTTRAAQGGSGLGLTIAQTILRMHQGTLELKSMDPVCFELKIPKADYYVR